MNDLLRCLILPISNRTLILPYSAIAEVMAFETPEPLDKQPAWLAGMLNWHEKQIPLIYFEQMALQDKSIAEKSYSSRHIAVLNRISDNALDFFGIILPSIPRMQRIKRGDLVSMKDKPSDYILLDVKYGDEVLSIPNVEQIAATILKDIT